MNTGIFTNSNVSSQCICTDTLERKRKVSQVIESHKSDKLLIRTLYHTPGYFDNLEWELSELFHIGDRKSSSATYLPYQIPVIPLGKLGLLLNMDNCYIEGIYSNDAGVSRVDLKDRRIEWDKNKKHYVLDQEKTVIDSPSIKHRPTSTIDKVESIVQLKINIQSRKRLPIQHNETVVTYNKESIIGIAAVINRPAGGGSATNEQVLKDSNVFKQKVKDELGIDIPIYVYDCLNGSLSEMANTAVSGH